MIYFAYIKIFYSMGHVLCYYNSLIYKDFIIREQLGSSIIKA